MTIEDAGGQVEGREEVLLKEEEKLEALEFVIKILVSTAVLCVTY